MNLILLCCFLGFASAVVSISEHVELYAENLSSFSLVNCLNGTKVDGRFVTAFQKEIEVDERRKFSENLASALNATADYIQVQKTLLNRLSNAVDGEQIQTVLQDSSWPPSGIYEAYRVLTLLENVRSAAKTPRNKSVEELLYLLKNGSPLPHDVNVRAKRDYKDVARFAMKWSCKLLQFVSQKFRFEDQIVKYIMSKIPTNYRAEALQTLLTDGVFALTNYARTLCGQPTINEYLYSFEDIAERQEHLRHVDKSKLCYDQMKKEAERTVTEGLDELSDDQAKEIKIYADGLMVQLNSTMERLEETIVDHETREVARQRLLKLVRFEEMVLVGLKKW